MKNSQSQRTSGRSIHTSEPIAKPLRAKIRVFMQLWPLKRVSQLAHQRGMDLSRGSLNEG